MAAAMFEVTVHFHRKWWVLPLCRLLMIPMRLDLLSSEQVARCVSWIAEHGLTLKVCSHRGATIKES